MIEALRFLLFKTDWSRDLDGLDGWMAQLLDGLDDWMAWMVSSLRFLDGLEGLGVLDRWMAQVVGLLRLVGGLSWLIGFICQISETVFRLLNSRHCVDQTLEQIYV